MFCKWFLFKRFFEKYIPFRFFGRNQIQTNSDSDKSSFRVRFRHIYGKKRYICIWICLHLNLNLYESEFVRIWFLPQKNLGRKYLSKNIWREITYRTYLNKFFTEEPLKRHSRPQDWKEESLPKKIEDCIAKCLWWHLFYQKLSLKRNSYQTNIGRNMSTTNSLKRNLYQTIFERNSPQKQTWKLSKHIWREISTKQNLKVKFYKSISEEKLSSPDNLWRETLYQTNFE